MFQIGKVVQISDWVFPVDNDCIKDISKIIKLNAKTSTYRVIDA